MNPKGFSLIEVLIVIVIVGIISLALGTSLQGTMAAYRIEGQVKELQADVMNAQARAMHRNMTHFVQISAAGYQVTQDTNQDGVLNAGDTNLFAASKPFSDTVDWSGGTVVLNTRGIISATGGALPVTFRIENTTTSVTPDYDCMVFTQTRVNTGRWNSGSCDIR